VGLSAANYIRREAHGGDLESDMARSRITGEQAIAMALGPAPPSAIHDIKTIGMFARSKSQTGRGLPVDAQQ
jgi:hypothetical protein